MKYKPQHYQPWLAALSLCNRWVLNDGKESKGCVWLLQRTYYHTLPLACGKDLLFVCLDSMNEGVYLFAWIVWTRIIYVLFLYHLKIHLCTQGMQGSHFIIIVIVIVFL